MSVDASVFRCGVCALAFPVMQRHVHHKVPRAVGGKDVPSNLIELCSGCHGALHSVAYRMAGKEPKQKVLDSVYLLYQGDRQKAQACLELASKVHQELVLQKERGGDPDALAEVATVLRRRHKDILRRHCRDLGLSVEEYLRRLIVKDLLHRHGVQPDLESSNIRKMRQKPKTH